MYATSTAAAPATETHATPEAQYTDGVAYVLKGFPRLSESFISNEVRLLIRQGLSLRLFSIKGGDALAESDDLPPVHYLPEVSSLSNTGLLRWLWANLGPFISIQWRWWFRAPRSYLRALKFALNGARRYGQGGLKKTFIKEFLFATEIAGEIRRDPAITHIHAHFCHDATNVAWMCSLLTGLPFSFTAHAKDIYQNKLNPGDLLRRKLDAAAFVTTCTYANVHHLRRLARDPAKIHGIYHGLDLRRFRPAVSANGRPAGPLRLISVGRHVEKKGFSYLLDACVLLTQANLDFTLTILGETGPQTPLLEQQIRELKLDTRVRLNGPVPQTQLPRFYQQADVFLLPCVIVGDGDRDGIPNVMAEAMACAVPVVVSDVSGIPELVLDDDNGLLLPERDSAAIAAAVLRLAGDAELRQRLGRNARQSVERYFDADATHARLYELFATTLASHRARAVA